MKILPIITYHKIFGNHELNKENYALQVDTFEQQIRYLADNNFESVKLSNFLRPDYNDNPYTHKAIFITFDDGSSSDFKYAFPILKSHHYTGTFFITTDWVGKTGYVSWADLENMIRGGMSIQSHTVSHPFLPDLQETEVRKELSKSKLTLEKHLNIPVDFVSIPGGFSSRNILNIAREEKYKGVCTSVPGLNKIMPQPFVILKRFMITRNVSFEDFIRIVNCDLKIIKKMEYAYKFKHFLKQIFGNRIYYLIWSEYFKNIY